MTRHFFFLALSLFIFTTTYTQVFDKNEKSLYKTKKNQHTITYSPTVYFGYNYAHQFNPNLTLGVGLSAGLARFTLPGPIWGIEIRMFYRKYISDKTYMNLGLFAALLVEFQPFRGFEGEIFYGWEHFKIGQRVQAGYFQDGMSDNHGEKFIYVLNPLILLVNF
ncbi:MAG: hypothetical protein B6D61_00265 [Bacteroidetes bacterium 4484_249]|nr:MAG: hypothetical protein B6D61_00265 [Bacteroidetes bacterium 4484_249]